MAPSTAAKATEGVKPPIDIKSAPPFWKRKNGVLLYFLLTSSLLASATLGIDGVSKIVPCCFENQSLKLTLTMLVNVTIPLGYE